MIGVDDLVADLQVAQVGRERAGPRAAALASRSGDVTEDVGLALHEQGAEARPCLQHASAEGDAALGELVEGGGGRTVGGPRDPGDALAEPGLAEDFVHAIEAPT